MEPVGYLETGVLYCDDNLEQSDGIKEPTMNLSQTGGAAGVPFADMWLKLLTEGESGSAEKTQEFVEGVRKLHRLIESDDS